MLRMFNDCVVMLLVYCALALYMVPASTTLEGERAKRQVERRWLFGTVLLRYAFHSARSPSIRGQIERT
jgi:alpha-1,3-mannosyltransferase